jgi:phosphatidylglycerol---prolipoprotein diacylglyceryl transferase
LLFHSTTAFEIGGLAVKWYGLFIMSGVIAATLLGYRIAPLKGEDPEHIWGLLPYLVVFGIIGARIAYGVVRHDQFASPIELITRFRTGGIAIQGAIGGACIAGWIYCRVKGLRFLRWGDIIAPGLSLAQGMGRWGNYANQEEFGRPTKLPWGISISPDRLQAKCTASNGSDCFAPTQHFHPAFLYESIADISIALVLLYLFTRVMVPKRWRDGDIFGVYAILYGVTRLFTESIRVDRAHIGPLPGAYWASILFILIGLFMILRNRRLPPPNYALPTPPSDLETTRAAVPAAAVAVADVTRSSDRSTDDDNDEEPARPGITRFRTGYRRSLPRESDEAPPAPAKPANIRSSDDDEEDGALT